MVNAEPVRPVHILIIADQADSIARIRGGFSSWKQIHRISVAQTPSAAQQILSDDPPDIIFSALTFLLSLHSLLNPGDVRVCAYPVVIIAAGEEELDAIHAEGLGDLEVLFRSDPMDWIVPRVADRTLREWRYIRIRVSHEDELKTVREEMAQQERILHDQVDELRAVNSRLEESDMRFRELFTENVAGYALHEIITDEEGRPVDYRFIEVNPAFERMTGLSAGEILGKTAREVLPGLEPFWIETYGRVARTGESIHIGEYSAELDRFFEVTSYCPSPGLFATLVLDVTVRKRSEAALQESEERLRLTLDATSDGIWDWDLPTGNAVFSPRWYTMLGYEPGEMPASYATWRSLVHPDDLPVVEKKILEHISLKEDGYAIEMRMVTKSGDYKWILGKGKVVERTTDGSPIRMVGIHSDISRRKAVEEELAERHAELAASYEQLAAGEEELRANLQEITAKELNLRISEERLLMAQRIGHTGSWEYTIETDRIWGSAEAFRIYGFPAVEGDIEIETIEACIPDRSRVHQALNDLILDGREYDLEFVIHPADGSPPRVVRSLAVMESDDHGRPRTVTGVILDITDLKEKEEQLRETNAYLSNLIHHSNVPIVVWDTSLRITVFNRSCEELTGKKAGEALGLPLETLFPPSMRASSMRLIQPTLKGVRWENVGIDILHESGGVRTVSWNSSTIYSADGFTPVAVIAQGQDITERNQLERERSAALEQIQQNLAQLSILNDGIRNPLTVISLHADTLPDTRISGAIIREVERIDEMVGQLDRRWVESEKIFMYLEKHHQISVPKSLSSPDKAGGESPLSSPDYSSETARVLELQAELYTILDSMDALVYVADMTTYELLYMNQAGRRHFGDISGKRCFETLHPGRAEACPFCTNHLLTDASGPAGLHRWEYFDPLHGRWYDCRDRAIRWRDGRIVRLEIASDITRTRQVIAQLDQSEERLRQITETIPILYYVYDRESGRFLYASPAYETIWGRQRSDLYGDPNSFIEAVHPEDRSYVLEAVRKEIEEDTFLDIEYRIILPDGTIRWIHSRDFQVRNGEGRSYRIVGYAEDITERKEVKSALLNSEEMYRTLTEQVHDGICIYHEDRFLFVNTHVCEITGYSKDELYRMSVWDLILPEDRDHLHPTARDHTYSGERSGTLEARIMTRAGMVRTLEISISEIRFNGMDAVLGAARDITAHKETEQSLRETSERYVKLVQNIPDYILVHRNGIILFVNDAAARSFGYSSEELIGSDIMGYLTRKSQEMVRTHIPKREAGDSFPPYEITIVARDGTTRTVSVHGALIQFEGGPASLNILTDVTEQHRVMKKIRENEEKFRNIFDMMNDGIHINEVLPDGSPGRFIDLNQVACRMVGYSRDEILSRDPGDISTGSSGLPVDEIIRGMAGTGHVMYETGLVTRDGRTIPVEINAHRVVLLGKEVIVSVVRDITSRKQVEDALRRSETKYREVVENVNEAMVVAQDGMLKLVNARMAELTGYPEEELLSRPFIWFIHPADQEKVLGTHYQRLAGGCLPSRYSFRLLRRDGRITWVEISAVLISWDGAPATLDFLLDITERKQAEEAVLESNRKLRLLTSLTRHDLFNQVSVAEQFTSLAMSTSDISRIREYLSGSQEAYDRSMRRLGWNPAAGSGWVSSSPWRTARSPLDPSPRRT